ncbi:MAG TPA: N-acetylmuramoyl-L-alanine amidase [Gemmatimonadales bacterium]|nr:N-acetylmuramoyl-L-alanine amidase [Gemmatimonadales bacterium]
MTGLVVLSLLLAAPAPAAPQSVTVATPRGELELPVRTDASGGPIVFASPLVIALGGEVKLAGAWAEVTIARRPLRLLIGSPFYVSSNRVQPMAGSVSQIGDTLFVPLDFLTTVLPREFPGRLRWDSLNAHLIETGWVARVRPADPRSPGSTTAARPAGRSVPRLPNGLRTGHLVTVDAGHGGEDPGTRGVFLPRGMVEKDITLKVALMLREELQDRGVKVRMTRTTDVRPDLVRRAPMCGADCDLFVSLHVDALDPRRSPNYRSVDGFHTIIIGEANTAESDRIARLENEALRFETPDDGRSAGGALGFILKDLQMNEYLHESERAGALVQEHLAPIHPGRNLGVKQSNILAVLNTARRPAILVEMGFSSHRSDAAFLASSSGQRKIAQRIAEAIVNYLLEFERRSGIADPAEGGS